MARERFDSFTDEDALPQQPQRGPSLPSNGLPRAPSRNQDNSLSLRRYASSTSASRSTSPILPPAFYEKAGSLRVPGGLAPVLPGDDRSPFRFLEAGEEAPSTPMDVSPVTPHTPRFPLQHEYQPLVVSSSPISPDPRTLEFHTSAKVPIIHVNRRPSHYGHRTQYLGSYDAALDEECDSMIFSSSDEASAAPTSPIFRSVSRSQERGRPIKAKPKRELHRLSTRSLSPPRHRHFSPVERPFATTNVTDPLLHVDDTTRRTSHIHSRNLSVSDSSTSGLSPALSISPPLDRSGDFDFAAARDALKRQESESSSTSGYFQLARPKTSSSGSGRKISYPISISKPGDSPLSVDVPTKEKERPKIVPTPTPPALFRLGSKLKREVKGVIAAARKGDDTNVWVETKEMKMKKIEVKHWTDLDY